MAKRKSGKSKVPPTRRSTKPAKASLPKLPPSSSTQAPTQKRLEPGPGAAEAVYRAAQDCALIEARRIAQSEEEAIKLLPDILAKLMVDLNIAALAMAFAEAKDPNMLKMQLLHELSVERYRRSMTGR